LAIHPRERRSPSSGFSRRDFLKRTGGAALAAPSLAAILAACTKPGTLPPSSQASGPGQGAYWPKGSPYPLARQNAPVTWDLWKDPIASGLSPEKNATLQIFNWSYYLWPKVVKDFCNKYQCDFQITTFNNMDDAMAKMRTGQLKFDVFFPTPDVIGKLVSAHLIQPLNHDYIPHLVSDAWDTYQNPFYDQKWRYTVPYTVYTTGVGYRRDIIPDDQINAMSNPYEILWDPTYKGKVGIYDDYREAISMALLKNGITDLNTGSQADLNKVQTDLVAMVNAVDVRTDINGAYLKLPKGEFDVHQAWSGDMVAAWFYTPEQNMKGWETVGYWFPQDRKGAVFNDTLVVPANAEHPVLAHLFLDWMMTSQNALLNFSWNGYQPPQKSADPSTLTTTKSFYKEPYVFPWLESAVVDESDFKTGYFEAELTPQVDQLWHNVWQAFNSGVSG
jgi:spermidine/putrescine transport system substrate-binding protein